MIKYRKGYFGFNLLRQIAGTTWPHGIVPGLFSASIGLVLSLWPELDERIRDDKFFLVNPYPYQLFAYLLGFSLVFHTNFGYGRYWDAIDAVQRMGAKWLDGACMAIVFDAKGDSSHPFLQSSMPPRGGGGSANEGGGQNSGRLRGVDHVEYFVEIVHLFSLMHALALMHLRGDTDLSHLRDKTSVDSCVTSGGGNLTPRTYEKLKNTLPQASGGSTGTLEAPPVLTFGVSRWGNLWATDKSKIPGLRLKVLGGILPEEMKKLENDGAGRPLPTVARVTMVESWIMRRMIARQKHEPAGDMGKTGPPILSRMVQVVSDGNLGFGQASKTAETPFPFPYQNMIRVFLWMFAFTVPAVINATLLDTVSRFVINFITVWAYFSIAELSDNIEDPFIAYDQNDLPLGAVHQSFNSRLLSFGDIPWAEPKPSSHVAQ